MIDGHNERLSVLLILGFRQKSLALKVRHPNDGIPHLSSSTVVENYADAPMTPAEFEEEVNDVYHLYVLSSSNLVITNPDLDLDPSLSIVILSPLHPVILRPCQSH